jgi:EAL domain-containing protein (putative c-di-GMP-specific phosphodiesterase class I)
VGQLVAREAAGMPALALCSIKLLGSSFRQLSFQKFIGDQLSLLRVPGQLCLEVSESAALNHLDDSAAFIARLRGYGCRFALDEFGSGPLSFASLPYLPVDYVKIAGAFVGDCSSEPIGLAVLESIQRIVRAMDIESIACAIDNPLVLAKVRQPGVDFCAGSYFGRPRQWRPLEQIAAVN